MIPTLLSCLGPEHSWVVQTAAGDFIKAIITISANASQNEQQCIGPNELTRQLVSRQCVEQLIGYMLGGGNPLTVGVGIVIEVIRKNNSDYDPDVGTGANSVPSAHDPIYLGHLLRLFAENVPKFMDLIMGTPAQKDHIASTFGEKLEPLGFDRFKTCELMAELLHCSNMGLLNEVGSEDVIAARDAERSRLRSEGKLGPQKEEDLSADNLTMRMSHTGQEEGGRRLEVTNADDDGFEEVEPSKEMSEDTSHEFIKAEDDMPAAQPPSFLDKDGDDFVDEPLSSPRLSVGADKVNEQQFEDPDLVVAPLSPTKAKAAEPVPAAATSTSATEASTAEPKSQDAGKPEGDSSARTTASIADSPPEEEEGLSLPVTGPSTPTTEKPEADLSEGGKTLSPRPEDTPAPLFSAPAAPESGAERPPETKNKVSEAEPSAGGSVPAKDVAGAEEPTEGQGKAESTGTVDPVVGDFLKIQFVDHHVVPTILVRIRLSRTLRSASLTLS
jgi:SIT4-associating protein SAP185/190